MHRYSVGSICTKAISSIKLSLFVIVFVRYASKSYFIKIVWPLQTDISIFQTNNEHMSINIRFFMTLNIVSHDT